VRILPCAQQIDVNRSEPVHEHAGAGPVFADWHTPSKPRGGLRLAGPKGFIICTGGREVGDCQSVGCELTSNP